MNTTQSNQETFPKSTRALALLCGALPGLFLLVTSTTRLVEGQFVYDVKRLLQLCLMLVLFLAAGLNPGLRSAFAVQFGRIPSRVKALLALIIVLGVISSAVAATSRMHLAYSLLEVALLSMLVLAVLVIAACRAVAGDLFDQVAITLLALTAIAVGIQELVGVAAVLAIKLEFHSYISLVYYSFPRFYNQVQGWTLPVIAALPVVWSRSRSQLLRSTWFQAMVCLTALGLQWYIVLMSGGRGVALALTASFVICLIIFPSIRKASLRWHLPGLILGTMLFIAIAQIQERVLAAADLEHMDQIAKAQNAEGTDATNGHLQEKSGSQFAEKSLVGRLNLDSSGRWWLWRYSFEDIKTHPMIGIGPMNYACTGGASRAAHPHNFPLQFAGEWGMPATLALLVIVGFSFFGLLRGFRQMHGSAGHIILGTLLTTGLVAAVGHSLLSGVLVMPASQVAGVLIGGWLMGLIPVNVRLSTNQIRTSLPLLIIGILICLACAAFSFSEARHREYREGVMPATDHLLPRYWQQGKFCKYLDEF